MSQIILEYKISGFEKTINWTNIQIRITFAQIKTTLIQVQFMPKCWIHSHKHENSYCKIHTPRLVRFALYNSPARPMWCGDYATYHVEVMTSKGEWTWSSWIFTAAMPRAIGSTLFLVGSGRRSIVATTLKTRSDGVCVAVRPRSSRAVVFR